jgi:glutamyl-tRNA reductase
MTLIAVGLNHQTAPLALRERVAFPAERLSDALLDLKQRLSNLVPESAILSTCNRTEIYVASNASPPLIQTELAQWLSQHNQLTSNELTEHLYLRNDNDAVRHAFRVASGLDSMVLGEPQILGQMKDAARAAQSAHSLGTQLHQLFQRSFAVAKQVRSSTDIGTQSVSMAAASVKLCQRVFGELNHSRVLFIGAGEMIELCATHFAAQSPASMVVANRTLERAANLAKKINGQTISLGELSDQLGKFDVVVSCTASSLPLIGLGMVERAIKARRRRPMVMIDLAVPRDIEPEVAQLSDVFIYTVDDLGKMIQTNMATRQAAVSQAETIIDTGVQGFMQWLAQRDTAPSIKYMHDRANEVARLELDRAKKMLAKGDDPSAVLEKLAKALTSKFMHGPTEALKQASQATNDQTLAMQQLIEQMIPKPPTQDIDDPSADIK